MEINKVGVIGLGLMGSGIAQVCAQAGFQTKVSEINDDLLNKGLAAIEANFKKNVARGKMQQADMDAAMGRFQGKVGLDHFSDCDLVIEVAIEKMQIKKQIFADLDKITPQHAILATNTSCLSVIEIASVTTRLDKVLGMHFFNPVPIMRLLELVRTIATSNETLDNVKVFGAKIGKDLIVAKDTPGFVVNALLVPYLFDAMRMLENGVATREDIDTGIKLGLNHPMGPLTLSDFIGLDTLHFIGQAMHEDFKDPKYASPIILKKMVTAGWLGKKSGKGFYDYQ